MIPKKSEFKQEGEAPDIKPAASGVRAAFKSSYAVDKEREKTIAILEELGYDRREIEAQLKLRVQ